MMQSIPRFGSGGSRADEWAVRIAELVHRRASRPSRRPTGYNMIPGLFSWANTIAHGRRGGRHAQRPPRGRARSRTAPTPIPASARTARPRPWPSPSPRCSPAGATRRRCRWSSTRVRPGRRGMDRVTALIRAHCDLGGTQINLNILDREQILAAHEDPSRYPDLVVWLYLKTGRPIVIQCRHFHSLSCWSGLG